MTFNGSPLRPPRLLGLWVVSVVRRDRPALSVLVFCAAQVRILGGTPRRWERDSTSRNRGDRGPLAVARTLARTRRLSGLADRLAHGRRRRSVHHGHTRQ